MAWLAAAEVAGRNGLSVAFVGKKFDEPGFVLDFLVENAGGKVVGARVLAEGHIADGDPAADGAAFRFEEQREDVDGGGRVGQLGGDAAGLIVEFLEVLGEFTTSS